jgi:hypothetical protein
VCLSQKNISGLELDKANRRHAGHLSRCGLLHGNVRHVLPNTPLGERLRVIVRLGKDLEAVALPRGSSLTVNVAGYRNENPSADTAPWLGLTLPRLLASAGATRPPAGSTARTVSGPSSLEVPS